jgi:hypothetical protein
LVNVKTNLTIQTHLCNCGTAYVIYIILKGFLFFGRNRMKNFSSISSHSVFLSNAFRAACSQSLQKCHLKAAKQSKATQSKRYKRRSVDISELHTHQTRLKSFSCRFFVKSQKWKFKSNKQMSLLFVSAFL